MAITSQMRASIRTAPVICAREKRIVEKRLHRRTVRKGFAFPATQVKSTTLRLGGVGGVASSSLEDPAGEAEPHRTVRRHSRS